MPSSVDAKAHIIHGLSLSVSLSPSSICPCLCLSDKLGVSLFRRKCSHHTDSRLVYSRFNLIIASPASTQPASACFMLRPCYKHKIDFDTCRLVKLPQKSSTETQDETACFLWNILCVYLLGVLMPLSFNTRKAAGGEAAASDTYPHVEALTASTFT